MNSFCTEEHLQEWFESSGGDGADLFFLSVPEARVVSEWLFGLDEE